MTELVPPTDHRPAPDCLKERVILVTGAGSGIGAAVARALAAHGATVILVGRMLRKLEAVYDQIVAAGHPLPAIHALNFQKATPADFDTVAQAVQQGFGRLDGLVHNAALLGTPGPLDHVRPDDWDALLRVNLTAPFLLTRALLPALRAAPDPALVFVSDAVGRKARAYWGPYAVSKAGLEGLMQVAADELEGRARVYSLDTGPVNTVLRLRAYPGDRPHELPQPEQITDAFVYLLGPAPAALHGQALDTRVTSRGNAR